MTSKKETRVSAYMHVNHVSKADAALPEHDAVIESALEDVWSYKDLMPGENDTLRDKRLAMEGPPNGEYLELFAHLKEIDPETYKGLGGWQAIYTARNIISKQGDVKQEESMEKHEMPIDEIESAVDDITMRQGSLDDFVTSKPKEGASAETKKAAAEVVNATREKRLNFSRTSVVTRIVVAKPEAVKIFVKGKEAKGVIHNPEKALSNFKEKTGWKEVDGVVSFANVPSIQMEQERALDVYRTLLDCVQSPNKELNVYLSKGLPQVKGFYFAESENETAKPIKPVELREIVANKAFGAVSFTGKKFQVKLGIITRNKVSTNVGARGTGIKKDNNKDAYSGVASLQVTDKTEAIKDFGKFWKNIVPDKTEVRPGPKSDIGCCYYSKKMSETGVPKKIGYRIPLLVEQSAYGTSAPLTPHS